MDGRVLMPTPRERERERVLTHINRLLISSPISKREIHGYKVPLHICYKFSPKCFTFRFI
jgi:hypothetical protein